jgi:hypothetical protein
MADDNETEIEEVRTLKVGDLLKMRRRFKGVNKAKIKRGAKKAARNPVRNIAARSEKLAKRHARNAAAERLSGGKKKADQSLADRVRISNRISKSTAIKKRIDREAKKGKRIVRRELIQSRHKKKTNEALEAKSAKWDISFEILEQVFSRGLDKHHELEIDHLTAEQYAFARVNSFLAGGAALQEDIDLVEEGGAGEFGTKKLRDKYLKDTPHASMEHMYSADKPEPVDTYLNQTEGFNLMQTIKGLKKK